MINIKSIKGAMQAVKRQGTLLEFVPEEFKTIDVCKDAIKKTKMQ